MSQPITVEKYAVGQSVRRVEDVRLLQGLGRYSDDVRLPRQVAAAIVRSTHAHARIVRVDAAAAEAAPGVLAVWTEADLAADGLGNLPTDASRKRPGGAAAFATPRPALARGRVRHVGDPVVLVVAETREQATDAAALVHVEYEPLPAVAATADARRPGAPAVWDEAPDNIAFVWQAGSREAVDRAFAAAAHVTRLDFTITRVAVAPLEPRAAVGEYDRRTARYTLHTGIQGPHGSRAILADILHVPQSHVRVVTGEVGGSFGMRSGMYPEMALVLWAAKRLGRPVGWTSDRREAFVTDEHGRDNVSTAELALDAGGRFLGLRVAIGLNIGAYLTPRSAGPGTNNVGGLAGVYTTPAICVETTGVFSNTTPTGPYRGAGRPEATYAIERVIDLAARELGVDPVELRRRNVIPPSAMPFKTGLVFTYDCGEFARGMDMALALADRAGFEKRRAEARERGALLGLGIANPIEVAGGPYTAMNPDTAELRDQSRTAPSPCSRDRPRWVRATGRPSRSSWRRASACRPTGYTCSRVTRTTWAPAGAMAARARWRRGRLRGGARGGQGDRARPPHRRALLEAAHEDVAFRDGRFVVAGTDRGVTLGSVAKAAYQPRQLPAGMEPGFDERARSRRPRSRSPMAARSARSRSTPRPGAVRVVRHTVVDDVGRMVNPMLVKGQIHGGIVQGLGQGLFEDLVYDREGQLLSGSFMDYAMPRADDMPFFDVDSHEVPTQVNPLGAKGVGEAGTSGRAARRC